MKQRWDTITTIMEAKCALKVLMSEVGDSHLSLSLSVSLSVSLCL